MAIGGCHLKTERSHVPSQDSQWLTGAISTEEPDDAALPENGTYRTGNRAESWSIGL